MRILNGENRTATTNDHGDVTVDVISGTSFSSDDITGALVTVEDAYANFARATRIDGMHYRFRIYKLKDGAVVPAVKQQVTFNWVIFG